ncbi:MAG: DUF4340 domain-containing protein [Salinibacter sp.]
MTNATQTLALIFAGTLALALATSWSWSTTSSAAFQRDLLAVDTSAVQAVRLDRSDRTSVQLKRTSNGWEVTPTDTSASYPANAQSVRQLLGTLSSLQVSAVATRQPDKHPQYGVDSTGTTVAMLGEGGETLGKLIVGRTNIRRPQGGQGRSRMRRRMRRGTPITYVRSPDRPDVYSIEQSLRSLTSRSVEGWRNKQIWAISRDNIQRIKFQYPADSSFTMTRVSRSDTSAAPDAWVSAGDTLAQSEISSLLSNLSTPTAQGFAEGMRPNDLGEAPYTIRLQLAGNSRRTLHLRPNPNGNTYLATAEGYPYVTELRKSTWDRSVLQGRSAFLKNN